ncbi:MAG: cytidylyltransferase domain-containing protein [bacterium]
MPVQEILAIVPARRGSKSIPHKNVREVAGKPLLAWSIEHAVASRRITRVIISTDSAEYAKIARQYGAEAPFLRPEPLARDDTPDLPVFQHALQWLWKHEGYCPQLCVHLRPTCPVRDPNVIDHMVDILLDDGELDSVRTVAKVLHPAFKMWYRNADDLLSPVVPALPNVPEPWNSPRQTLPTTYLQTANIDVVRTRVITQQDSMTGTRIRGYIENNCLDIDTPAELDTARCRLEQDQTLEDRWRSIVTGQRCFCFDIDGVIATLTPNNDYHLCQPRRHVISIINKLYEAGHHITLFTARGSQTGLDWQEVTESQLVGWGVKYHVLRFGKPAADYYVDDRMLSIDDLHRLEHYCQEVVA